MKQLFFLLALLFTSISYAQFNNNSRQRQSFPSPQQQQSPKPKFEVEKYVGIIIYDVEKAAKKTGVKLSSTTGKTFSTTLKNYNKSIKDIERINSFVLKSTKNMVESFQKKAIETGDFSNQPKVMKAMNETLKPVSESIQQEDKAFDAKMKSVLSKKQYLKWIKYNRKLNKTFYK
ncbi:hypothetical protein [uncultured Polaribacter sp.]|uniref:hypothetical protein n=1 Tax=uncultured Polaribacter sp. TaxID=174711 RepID=UPI0026367C28|nr:hypothetical protein [uncultured Polaribacter sp.]